MNKTFIYCGTQRSSRKEGILQIIKENYPHVFLIVPTRQYAQKRSIELLNYIDTAGIYGDIVSDFSLFAYNLLQRQGLPVRKLEEWEQNVLMKSIILSEEGKQRFKGYKGLLAPENLANAFCRVIRNLKQAGITPEEFESKLKLQRVEPWDEVLSWVYSVYQQRLTENYWYDIPGLFWQAEIECQQGQPAYLKEKQVLAFDGFDDFTYSELRLIKALGPHFDKIVIGINLDLKPNRRDVYQLAADTLERLRSMLEVEVVSFETPKPSSCIEYIADNLFWRDEPIFFTSSERSTLKINHYINREEEVKNIGRKVKQLIVQEHVPPEKIAVSYRRLDTVRPLIEKIFTEFGIPFQFRGLKNIKQTRVCQFLERWFSQLRENNFSAITYLLHDPIWNIPVSLSEKFFLILQNIGLSLYMPVEYIRKRLQDSEALLKFFREDGKGNISEAEIKLFCEECIRWLSWRDKFLEQDSVKGFISTTLELLQTLESYLKEGSTIEESDRLDYERKGYQQVIATLKHIPTFFQDCELSLDEFQRLVLSLLSDVPLFNVQSGYGVVCQDLPMIRNLEYDYLFVGGVEEGLIPLSPSLNAIYSEKDMTTLRSLGLPVDDFRKQIQREWLFFQQVFEIAREGVYLSHVLFSETHEERSPSLLLRELQEVCKYIKDEPLLGQEQQEETVLPCSPLELQEYLFLYQEDEEVLKQEYPDVFVNWYALQKREELSKDIYTGCLQSSDIQEWLAQRFGSNHVYSVDQIESYVECPFSFFVKRVLNLKDWEEELVQPTPLMFGSWSHDILCVLLRDYYDELLKEGIDNIDSRIKELLEKIVRKDRKVYVLRDKVVEITINWLTHVLSEFIRSGNALVEVAWKPAYFELAFGNTMYSMEDTVSQHRPFCMDIKDKQVLFSGRIDRIDKNNSEPTLRIIDYKWGNTPTKTDMGVKNKVAEEKINSIQLIIYELAVENHLFKEQGLSVTESYFLPIRGKRPVDSPWSNNNKLRTEIQQKVEELIYQTIQNIHRGYFSPEPSKKVACEYCFCKNACRYKRIEQSDTEESASNVENGNT